MDTLIVAQQIELDIVCVSGCASLCVCESAFFKQLTSLLQALSLMDIQLVDEALALLAAQVTGKITSKNESPSQGRDEEFNSVASTKGLCFHSDQGSGRHEMCVCNLCMCVCITDIAMGVHTPTYPDTSHSDTDVTDSGVGVRTGVCVCVCVCVCVSLLRFFF